MGDLEEDALFIKKHYETHIFAKSSLYGGNMIGRIRNELVHAVNSQALLPRVIVIIPDNDILTSIPYKGMGISDAYDHVIHWLADEFNKIIEVKKDTLHFRAIKHEFPAFIWMAPPQNMGFEDNEFRAKFTRSLKNVLTVLDNHTMLKLKKIWSFDEPTLFAENKFTKRGFRCYWYSVDSAIEFWHNHLATKKSRPKAPLHQRLPRIASVVSVPRPDHTNQNRSGDVHADDYDRHHNYVPTRRRLDYEFNNDGNSANYGFQQRCDRLHWQSSFHKY